MANSRRAPGSLSKIVAAVVLIAVVTIVYALLPRRSAVEGPIAAQQAYERKDWQQAADWARSRLKTDESDTSALRMLARTSIRMGKDSTAAAIYNGRLRAEPMEPEDYYLMGLSYTRQGDDELALKAWSKGVAEAPDHPEMLLSLANLMARRQHFDETVDLAGRLAKIPGWEAAGLLLLGTARFSLEDYPAAAAALQKGLELDPEATAAPLEASVYRKILARSLLLLGRPKEADVWLQPVLHVVEKRPRPIPRPTGSPADPPCSKASAIEPGTRSPDPEAIAVTTPSFPNRAPTRARRSVLHAIERSARLTSKPGMLEAFIMGRSSWLSLARMARLPTPIIPRSPTALCRTARS